MRYYLKIYVIPLWFSTRIACLTKRTRAAKKPPPLSPAEPYQALGLLSSRALSSWQVRAFIRFSITRWVYPYTKLWLILEALL